MDIGKLLGDKDAGETEAEAVGDESVQDIGTALGVEVKDPALFRSALKTLVMECMNEDEGEPSAEKPRVAEALGD